VWQVSAKNSFKISSDIGKNKHIDGIPAFLKSMAVDFEERRKRILILDVLFNSRITTLEILLHCSSLKRKASPVSK